MNAVDVVIVKEMQNFVFLINILYLRKSQAVTKFSS